MKNLQDLLERKQSLKNRISALSKELQPHLRATENLRQRIDLLETDLHQVMDSITNEETTKRNQAARERASHQEQKEWVVDR